MPTASILPSDLLPIGTRVRVPTRRGILRGLVIEAKMVSASNNGGSTGAQICLHTIEFTERCVRGTGGRHAWAALAKSEIRRSNYAFIEVDPIKATK